MKKTLRIMLKFTGKYIWILIFLSLFIINPRVGWNASSRLATIQSIVEEQSLSIDNTYFVNTGDKVYIDDHFYSDKPPLPSFIGAIVYAPLYYVFGLSFNADPEITYYLVTFFSIKLVWLLGIIAFYKSLGITGTGEQNRKLITFALALGTLMFTWSVTFNNHVLAASFISIGFYYYLKYQHVDKRNLNITLASIFLALAGSADIPVALFFVLFGIYLAFHSKLKITLVYYVLPALLVISPTLIANLVIHESIFPVQIEESYFNYPGSPWQDDENDKLSGVQINEIKEIPGYIFHSLIGYRGFILYNPLLLIALAGIFIELKRKNRFFNEAIVISSSIIIIMLYYFVMTNNYGGNSYSIRWFVPFLPLLMFYCYSFFGSVRLFNKERVFISLLILSMLISFIGIVNPWSNMDISPSPLVSNIDLLNRFIARFLF